MNEETIFEAWRPVTHQRNTLSPSVGDTLSRVHWELDDILARINSDIEKQCADLTYRMERGIYGTPYDETAEVVWARLRVAQDAEPWDMFGTFSALDELARRGQTVGWRA